MLNPEAKPGNRSPAIVKEINLVLCDGVFAARLEKTFQKEPPHSKRRPTKLGIRAR